MADADQAPEARNGPSQSKIVLAKPRLGAFGGVAFSSDSSKAASNSSGPVLRPPQLKPAFGGNPFLRSVNPTSESKESQNKEEKHKESTKDDVEPPKFVPLEGTGVKTGNPVPAPSQPASSSSSSGFVFGQNLSERVMVAASANSSGIPDHSSTNGNSELLFTNAVASNAENNKDEPSSSDGTGGSEGLAAAAAEYERNHARPLPAASHAPTTTGEEDETNVLQVTCRLFAWESGSWRERGRGSLRLNDCGGGSRVVFRVLGSLRVVLNTKVWPEMVADRAGAKSLRITAADSHNQVKVFLIMASPSDILHLHRELATRISQAKPVTTDRASHSMPSDYTAPPVDHLPDESEKDHEKCHSNDIDDNMSNDGLTAVKNDSGNMVEKENGKEKDAKSEESPSLKRKETETGTEVSPKRQCPEIVIE